MRIMSRALARAERLLIALTALMALELAGAGSRE
jgi:hypothetical protein